MSEDTETHKTKGNDTEKALPPRESAIFTLIKNMHDLEQASQDTDDPKWLIKWEDLSCEEIIEKVESGEGYLPIPLGSDYVPFSWQYCYQFDDEAAVSDPSYYQRYREKQAQFPLQGSQDARLYYNETGGFRILANQGAFADEDGAWTMKPVLESVLDDIDVPFVVEDHHGFRFENKAYKVLKANDDVIQENPTSSISLSPEGQPAKPKPNVEITLPWLDKMRREAIDEPEMVVESISKLDGEDKQPEFGVPNKLITKIDNQRQIDNSPERVRELEQQEKEISSILIEGIMELHLNPPQDQAKLSELQRQVGDQANRLYQVHVGLFEAEEGIPLRMEYIDGSLNPMRMKDLFEYRQYRMRKAYPQQRYVIPHGVSQQYWNHYHFTVGRVREGREEWVDLGDSGRQMTYPDIMAAYIPGLETNILSAGEIHFGETSSYDNSYTIRAQSRPFRDRPTYSSQSSKDRAAIAIKANGEIFFNPIDFPTSTSLTLKSIESNSKNGLDPKDMLPNVDSEKELEALRRVVGITSRNELQRSRYYRNRRQVDLLRQELAEFPEDKNLSILNIGPGGHAEEATIYAALAQNANLLERTNIRFVDLETRDSIETKTNLGKNIAGMSVRPPDADMDAYVREDEIWHFRPEIQKFLDTSIEAEDNYFGTAVEEFCRREEDKKYHVVTANNVAQYLGRGEQRYDNPIYQKEGNFEQFQAVLLSTAEKVEAGGLLFAEGPTKGVMPVNGYFNAYAVDQYLRERTNFEDVYEIVNRKHGIYRRKNGAKLVMKKE